MNHLNTSKDLTSILHASHDTELSIVYIDDTGEVQSTKVSNSELLLSINEKEFLVLERYFVGTGIKVKNLAREEFIKEETLYVE